MFRNISGQPGQQDYDDEVIDPRDGDLNSFLDNEDYMNVGTAGLTEYFGEDDPVSIWPR